MFAIVVNPVSGDGQNAALAGRVAEILAARGQACRVMQTACAGDGERQTRLALAAGCEAVVCVGGDGTLSEVVCALAGSGCTLYIVPGGTGNDFARAFGLPRDPIAAFCAQMDGRPEAIDCGSINGQPFLNVSGSGFDVEVLRKTEELKRVYPGNKAYRKAVLSVLGSYRALEAQIAIDGGDPFPYRGTIVEIANGRYIGGGMQVAPGAKIDDGRFDVVMVDRVPSRMIPLLLPLFILGAHVHLPIAHVVRAQRVTIRARGMVVNIDGRLEAMDEAAYAVLPGALHVMRPIVHK